MTTTPGTVPISPRVRSTSVIGVMMTAGGTIRPQSSPTMTILDSGPGVRAR